MAQAPKLTNEQVWNILKNMNPVAAEKYKDRDIKRYSWSYGDKGIQLLIIFEPKEGERDEVHPMAREFLSKITTEQEEINAYDDIVKQK